MAVTVRNWNCSKSTKRSIQSLREKKRFFSSPNEKKRDKRLSKMIHVTHQPLFGRGVRAFTVPETLKEERLSPEFMSILSEAYFGYFSAADMKFDDPAVVSTVAIFIDLGEEHSWKWHFVCDRDKQSGSMQVIAAFILDGSVETSTLEKDVPGMFRLLPPPIDVDQKTEELMTKLEDAPRQPPSDDAATMACAAAQAAGEC